MVERRLKEALRQDRARIQVGAISHFGLMEMSRQRLRPSLVENSFVHCEHCAGTGLVRGVESASLHVLRAIESAGAPRDAAEIAVHVAPALALYILNNKRLWLAEIERRCVMQVHFEFDDTLQPPAHRIVKTQVRSPAEIPAELPTRLAAADPEPDAPAVEEEDASLEEAPERPPVRTIAIVEAEPAPVAEAADAAPTDTPEEAERKRKRRRRRRRGERREDGTDAAEAAPTTDEAEQTDTDTIAIAAEPVGELAEASALVEVPSDPVDEATPGRSRRGRRSGRRRSRRDDEAPADIVAPDAPQPVYSGPTPADPFNGAFDIFDVLARSEDEYMVNMSASAASFGSPAPAAPDHAEPAFEPEPQPDGEAELPLSSPSAELFAPPEPAASQPEPELRSIEPEPEPASEPAIQPILVGAGEPTARRSGWWRR
jgi:ribonuclease E